MNADPDYTLAYFQQTQRTRFQTYFRPSAVYPENGRVFVVLPQAVEFPCETWFWHTSTFAARAGMLRDDRAGAWAMLTTAIITSTNDAGIPTGGVPAAHFLFLEDEIRTMFRQWVYFLAPLRPGVTVNLLKAYYQRHAWPQLPKRSYEATHLSYEAGCLFADHPHLRKILGIA